MVFEPSQPLGIISGSKETFTKRYIVDKTNKAEIRPEEQSEKTESCQRQTERERVGFGAIGLTRIRSDLIRSGR